MERPMLSFVLSHLPPEWEDVDYTNNFHLFTLSMYDNEYMKVAAYFYRKTINEIVRVQNPFQYGRYMLRREMLSTSSEVSAHSHTLLT